MSAKPGVESRRTPRRVYQRPVGLLIDGGYSLVSALQLSEGGTLFVSGSKLKLNSPIVVSLVLPGTGCVVARGELIYERPHPSGGFQYGVRFSELQRPQRRLIRNYVAAKTQEEAEVEAQEQPQQRAH